ncbi:hypothetical protein GW17_00056827 [Ensete ventricosum]|nr:hypothetical protein GW17_00056827 [Ensete ventricosum]
MLRPGVTQEWVDKGEIPRERTKNRRWQRPYDVYDRSSWRVGLLQCSHSLKGARQVRGQSRVSEQLLGGHNGVEAGGQKGRGSDDESSGAQLPKSKASVRKEVDSEEHHSAAEADLPIAKKGMQMQVNG